MCAVNERTVRAIVALTTLFALALFASGCPGVATSKAPIQPLAITTSTLPQPTLLQAYSQSLQATGGVPPYAWSVAAGQLPAGLGLNAATGQVAGMPAQPGPSDASIEVSDNSPDPEQAAMNLSLTVQGPALDSYGGRTDLKCAQATGWFHAEKIGAHWWFCTPAGNAFFEQDVEDALYAM